MSQRNPLEASIAGYVAVYNDGPDGFSIGGYSKDATRLRGFAHGDPAVVSIKRAREIARDIHSWDIAPEEDLYNFL